MVKNPPTNLVQEESYMPWGWACVPQLLKPSYLAPKQEKSLQWEACTSQLENSPVLTTREVLSKWRPSAAKIKQKTKNFSYLTAYKLCPSSKTLELFSQSTFQSPVPLDMANQQQKHEVHSSFQQRWCVN